MSGIRLEVGINDRELQAAMLQLVARGKDLGAPLRSIGEMMLRSTDQRFRTQRDPEGSPWTPLQPGTLAKKRNSKILTEAGNLRGSIAYRVSGDRLDVGTPSIYGAIHQLGGEIKQGARAQIMRFHGTDPKKPGKFMSKKQAGKAKSAVTIRIASVGSRTIRMPARPYLGMSADDKARVVKILARHLAGNGP